METPTHLSPICPYCNRPSTLTTGDKVYGTKSLAKKQIWICEPCDARVGCHGNTAVPLGTLANAELRDWRKHAHLVFDGHWKLAEHRNGCPRWKARTLAYQWLAKKLGIEIGKCHIAMFNVQNCKETIELARATNFERMAQEVA